MIPLSREGQLVFDHLKNLKKKAPNQSRESKAILDVGTALVAMLDVVATAVDNINVRVG